MAKFILYQYKGKPGYYCSGPDPRTTDPKKVDLPKIMRKALCNDFVHWFVPQSLAYQEIMVQVETSSFEKAQLISVTRIGYHRWLWLNPQGFWKGMMVAAEEEAARFFPDLSMKADKEGKLWVRVYGIS